jgi:(p)ppGpp synthase/HD superfamily hydrolase
VLAALLHDVLEDTEVTEVKLREMFSQQSIDYVVQLTKKKEESREIYLSKFSSYPETTKLIKALDRYHNLLRAFTFIDNPTYLTRYINETEKYFYPEFLKDQTLSLFILKFHLYLEELKKLLASFQE